MMSKGSRILILVAALAMGLVYALPLWRISLEAPQYPEGLGMVIQVDNVVGMKPHDLENINNLNHYIGMKRIEPDAIPELALMPWILGVLIGLGLLTAAVGRRGLLYGWVGLFITVSVVGLADFWKWEYDYGHDLDEETAIIKVPGMSYQPPLIGSRQILNFKAHSWPGAGGWILIAGATLGVAVAGLEYRRGRRGAGGGGGSAPVLAALLVTTALAASACGEPEPRALAYGEEACEHCHMGLAQPEYGAELLTPTGRARVFDSVECLVGHLLEDQPEDVHSLWVVGFSDPGHLVRAPEAFYLRSETLKSPMGLGITAFARAQDRDGAMNAFGGQALDWQEVRELVATEWPAGRASAHGPGHAHMAGRS